MTIVYRVEHVQAGAGPFTYGVMNGRVDPVFRHPLPSRAFCQAHQPEWIFGTERLCDILRWFGQEHAILRTAGYVLRVFDVPDDCVARDKSQVSFDRSRAVLQSTIEFRPESEA